MVAKMLALAMIVAAVGAAAIENPLAGDKSDSGIESPAAGSAEYGDAEEIHGRDLDKSDRGSIDYEDAEEIHGRALKKSWKKAMKQDLKEVDQRVESLERRSGAINLPGPPGKKGVPGEKGEKGETPPSAARSEPCPPPRALPAAPRCPRPAASPRARASFPPRLTAHPPDPLPPAPGETGPVGETGPQGAQGPQGETGPAGPPADFLEVEHYVEKQLSLLNSYTQESIQDSYEFIVESYSKSIEDSYSKSIEYVESSLDDFDSYVETKLLEVIDMNRAELDVAIDMNRAAAEELISSVETKLLAEIDMTRAERKSDVNDLLMQMEVADDALRTNLDQKISKNVDRIDELENMYGGRRLDDKTEEQTALEAKVERLEAALADEKTANNANKAKAEALEASNAEIWAELRRLGAARA